MLAAVCVRLASSHAGQYTLLTRCPTLSTSSTLLRLPPYHAGRWHGGQRGYRVGRRPAHFHGSPPFTPIPPSSSGPPAQGAGVEDSVGIVLDADPKNEMMQKVDAALQKAGAKAAARTPGIQVCVSRVTTTQLWHTCLFSRHCPEIPASFSGECCLQAVQDSQSAVDKMHKAIGGQVKQVRVTKKKAQRHQK